MIKFLWLQNSERALKLTVLWFMLPIVAKRRKLDHSSDRAPAKSENVPNNAQTVVRLCFCTYIFETYNTCLVVIGTVYPNSPNLQNPATHTKTVGEKYVFLSSNWTVPLIFFIANVFPELRKKPYSIKRWSLLQKLHQRKTTAVRGGWKRKKLKFPVRLPEIQERCDAQIYLLSIKSEHLSQLLFRTMQ